MEFNTQDPLPRSPQNIGAKTAQDTPGLFPADIGRSDAFDPRTADVSKNAVLAGAANNELTDEARQAGIEKVSKAIGLPQPDPVPAGNETWGR